MKSADAKFRITSSDTEADIDQENLGGTYITSTEIVNAPESSTAVSTPTYDGSSIVTFAEHDRRYIGIQFEGAGDQSGGTGNQFNASTSLSVGCIMIGEYYDMPHSPDLSLKRSIIYDGVSVQESIGGQRYSNMKNFGRNVSSTSKSPFATTTANVQVLGGRQRYELGFSYLDATDVFPNEYDTYNPTDDSFIEDVWNRTNGNHLPFIFSIDNTSSGTDAESEHLFARFTNNSLNMDQVAPNVYNLKLTIEEEF